ncbi:hypothetical protein CIL05_18915 [Virgibacillus profundi]|uniref:DUF2512 domain-containing protein n=1 Tax=Virgibacillus profundi TaxID=2024555 RepID=A0A2A2I9F9_9BACI|nr:YndM family protein [Virgibacillus profundi]PAV27946.1 hypothetical protein CIL05_18915 [Virgibacillus profundi]PXY52124.1 DUF2512 domain-containing protein [Virgibacillus profundi]
MEHVKALLIKFVMCTAVLWVVLGMFYGVSFGDILTISVLLTGVSYVVGDLFLLPRFENWGATLADLGLAFMGTWYLGLFLIEGNIALGNAAIISALIIAAGEFFFHKYMANEVLTEEVIRSDEEKELIRQYQTEHSEELDGGSEQDKKE